MVTFKKLRVFITVIVFLVTLGILGGFSSSAQAAEIGQRLTKPEEGWKRYEDNNPNIKYSGTWKNEKNNLYFGQSRHCSTIKGSTVSFKFVGSKFLLLDYVATNRTADSKIIIDGQEENLSARGKDSSSQSVFFLKEGLDYKEHTIEIILNNAAFCLDAIDIDEDGYIIFLGIESPILVGEVVNNAHSLTWNSIEGATGYNIKRVERDGRFTTIANNITDTSYIVTDVNPEATYRYVISALVNQNEGAHSNEVKLPSNIETTNMIIDFNSIDTVSGMQQFNVDVNLRNASSIYAKDFTVQYDPDFFDFIHETTTAEGLFIYHKEESEGNLRYIIASHGKDFGIFEDTTLIQLTFKAKLKNGTSNIKVSSGLVADHLGNEYEIELGNKDINIVSRTTSPDVNRDGKVSLADLGMAGYDYGNTTENLFNPNTDVDLDGEVNELDLRTIVEEILR